MSENYKFIIENMRWSYSRLSSFYQCPLEWKYKYIDCLPDNGSFYTKFGNHCHGLLEKYLKGEISIFEISQIYEDTYNDNMPYDAPPNQYVDLGESYYQRGLDYFDNLDLHLENYIVLGVEYKVEFTLGGKPFVGFLDLLLKDKTTDEISIIDHKSGGLKFKKNGGIYSSDAARYQSYQRQLYIYSIPIIEKFGKVDYLGWNLIKDQKIYKIPFHQNDFESSKQWALNTIEIIENETEWLGIYNYNYCKYSCSQRETCEYINDEFKEENPFA